MLLQADAEYNHARRPAHGRKAGQVESMLRLDNAVVALRPAVDDVVTELAGRQLADHTAYDKRDSRAKANGTALEPVQGRVKLGHADGGQDVDECPAPGVEPEGEQDGRILEHVERGQEVLQTEATLRDQVALDVYQELPVGSLVCPAAEKER